MSRKHNAGKGDNRRPSLVTQDEIELRWRMAFGTKDEKEEARKALKDIIKRKARKSS